MIRRLTAPRLPPELRESGWQLECLPGGFWWCIHPTSGEETAIYDTAGRAIEHCWHLSEPDHERINKTEREVYVFEQVLKKVRLACQRKPRPRTG